jgi:bifunctional non-homologous end joining protein LigD
LVHEIKHDGYRLRVRRDGERVRCFTRNGHDWTDRFPAIVDAALRIQTTSFMLDGEAVVVSDDGRPDFHALRTRRTGRGALRLRPDRARRRRPARPAADRAQATALQAARQGQAGRHPVQRASDGRRPNRVRERLPHGAEGSVEANGCTLSQRPVEDVAQSKNPTSEAVRREREEEWSAAST